MTKGDTEKAVKEYEHPALVRIEAGGRRNTPNGLPKRSFPHLVNEIKLRLIHKCAMSAGLIRDANGYAKQIPRGGEGAGNACEVHESQLRISGG